MEICAQKIGDEKVRSMFLVELLNLTLQKGYSDDFPVYLEGVRQYITHPEALAALPALEIRYQESKETHKTIARGQMAPEFKAVDVKGKEYTSADFKGKGAGTGFLVHRMCSLSCGNALYGKIG